MRRPMQGGRQLFWCSTKGGGDYEMTYEVETSYSPSTGKPLVTNRDEGNTLIPNPY